MTQEQLIEILGKRRPGTMIRITYKTEPKPTAGAIRDNIRVTKIVETTVRWGCKYSNLKSVKAKKAEEERLIATGEISVKAAQKQPWWNWIPGYENILKSNISSGIQYFTLQPIPKGNHTRVQYFVNGRGISKTDLQELRVVQPSYWKTEIPDIFDIKIENILSIKSKKQNKIIYKEA